MFFVMVFNITLIIFFNIAMMTDKTHSKLELEKSSIDIIVCQKEKIFIKENENKISMSKR